MKFSADRDNGMKVMLEAENTILAVEPNKIPQLASMKKLRFCFDAASPEKSSFCFEKVEEKENLFWRGVH